MRHKLRSAEHAFSTACMKVFQAMSLSRHLGVG